VPYRRGLHARQSTTQSSRNLHESPLTTTTTREPAVIPSDGSRVQVLVPWTPTASPGRAREASDRSEPRDRRRAPSGAWDFPAPPRQEVCRTRGTAVQGKARGARGSSTEAEEMGRSSVPARREPLRGPDRIFSEAGDLYGEIPRDVREQLLPGRRVVLSVRDRDDRCPGRPYDRRARLREDRERVGAVRSQERDQVGGAVHLLVTGAQHVPARDGEPLHGGGWQHWMHGISQPPLLLKQPQCPPGDACGPSPRCWRASLMIAAPDTSIMNRKPQQTRRLTFLLMTSAPSRTSRSRTPRRRGRRRGFS